MTSYRCTCCRLDFLVLWPSFHCDCASSHASLVPNTSIKCVWSYILSGGRGLTASVILVTICLTAAEILSVVEIPQNCICPFSDTFRTVKNREEMVIGEQH